MDTLFFLTKEARMCNGAKTASSINRAGKTEQLHHFMGNRWGNSGNSARLYFWGAPKSLQMVTAAMKLKDAYSLEGKL